MLFFWVAGGRGWEEGCGHSLALSNTRLSNTSLLVGVSNTSLLVGAGEIIYHTEKMDITFFFCFVFVFVLFGMIKKTTQKKTSLYNDAPVN